METTLHRQLKSIYSTSEDQIEKKVGAYRIDVWTEEKLIEIQYSSLNSIKEKVGDLLHSHKVLVVKPVVVRKRIVNLSKKGGTVVSQRWSPKKGNLLDLFEEMLYFRNLFPHPNLTIEVPQVSIEEWRYKGHGKRRRRRESDYRLQDQLLVEMHGFSTFRNAEDLVELVSPLKKEVFSTKDLSESMDIPRWQAQKIAYTLNHTGGIEKVGKSGNSFLYSVASSEKARTKAA